MQVGRTPRHDFGNSALELVISGFIREYHPEWSHGSKRKKDIHDQTVEKTVKLGLSYS